MIITGIEPRKKGLSAIYIDGEFAVKLDTKTILENRVKVGADIDDEQLHFLIQQSDLQRAKDKALWLISYRDHSSRELEDKISRTCNREAAKGASVYRLWRRSPATFPGFLTPSVRSWTPAAVRSTLHCSGQAADIRNGSGRIWRSRWTISKRSLLRLKEK